MIVDARRGHNNKRNIIAKGASIGKAARLLEVAGLLDALE